MDEAKHLGTYDPQVLRRLRLALNAVYRDRLERVVLFGSRVRGDGRADSDYDVAVFLRGYSDLWTELQPLGLITTDILLDTGAVISAKPFPADRYYSLIGLMAEIRREGIEI
jgi:predicted nucleotidyltransferase